MEGSWGDEARIVESVDAAARLADTEPDWRPAAGDVILLAAAGAFAVATVVAGVAWFSLRRGWALWPVFQGLMWSVVALIGMAIQRGLSG